MGQTTACLDSSALKCKCRDQEKQEEEGDFAEPTIDLSECILNRPFGSIRYIDETEVGSAEISSLIPADICHEDVNSEDAHEIGSDSDDAHKIGSAPLQQDMDAESLGDFRKMVRIQGEDELAQPSDDLPRSHRTPTRRYTTRLLITHTMGMEPSNCLMIMIENSDAHIENHYKFGKILGSGSYGVVHKAKVLFTGALRAVKSITKSKMKESTFMLKGEVQIMKMLDHPNLLMLFEIFEDSDNFHLVLELCQGGSLDRLLKKKGRMTESQTAITMQQILRAVLYLHRQRICHRDMKADNCLLVASGPVEKAILKVADFGLSLSLEEGAFFTKMAGTPTHMAPEVLARKYRHPCDVWSCGVIAYNLLSGILPFKASKHEEIFKAIRQSSMDKLFGRVEWADIDHDCLNFLMCMMNKNPDERATPQELLEIPWLTSKVPHLDDMTVPSTLVRDLRKFRQSNQFKRAMLQTIASMLAEPDVRMAREIFVLLDRDGDGIFSYEELEAAFISGVLHQTGGIKSSSMPLEELMKELELMKDECSARHKAGGFTYTEFVAATFDQRKADKQGLFKAMFQTLDKNNDQKLQISEITTGRILGNLSSEAIAEVLQAFDDDGDGEICNAEFRRMFSAVCE